MRKDDLLNNMNLNGPIIRATSKRSETANESAIIDDLPVLICKLDQEGNIIYVNKSYRSFLGKSNEEILGNQFQYFDKEALNKNNFETGFREFLHLISPEKICMTY